MMMVMMMMVVMMVVVLVLVLVLMVVIVFRASGLIRVNTQMLFSRHQQQPKQRTL